MSSRRNSEASRGFGLLELLVVIAIIGLLASIVFASFTSVRANARDARRIGDIVGLQKALASYATDQRRFPIETTPIVITPESSIGSILLTNNVIDAIPSDPQSPAHEYEYSTNASGTTYTIQFCLETNTIRGHAEGCGNAVTP